MKKNNSPIIKSWSKSWITPLFAFFAIAVPAILLWLFFSKDINLFNIKIELWIQGLIALAFFVFTLLVTLLFIWLKLINLSILSFTIPISICFIVIFLTDQLEPWVRVLITVPFIFLIIPISIFIKKLEFKIEIKKRIKSKNDDEKIIGHK